MFRLILFVFAVLIVLILLAVRYLPWWGILLLLGGIVLFIRFATTRLFVALFMIPFKAKGAVLKNAVAEIRSVTWEPAPEKPARHEPPSPVQAAIEYDGSDGPAIVAHSDEPNDALAEDDEDEDDEESYDDQAPRDHFRIDVEITPRPKAGGFQFWEPGELRVVPFSTKSGITPNEENLDIGEPVEVEIFRDDRFEPDEECKYHGPLRLRMLMAVPLDSPRRLKFRYYFEAFGDLTLPPSGSTS